MTTWILVADENRGRIIATDKSTDTLVERQDLVHPESRLAERELTSDTAGRNQSNKNSASHGINEAGKVKAHHAQQFAKEIASTLNKAQQQNEFTNLILVAAPKFLGTLRKEIGGEVKKLVCFELDKDLTKLKISQIREHLPTHLPHH
ncbi:MAG: protein required for attachment to host cells [Arenicella sp.]|jgi:protein required for attachment to host cells